MRRHSLLPVLALMAGHGFAAPAENLARRAIRVAASEELTEFPARFAADGALDTFWSPSRKAVESGWIEFEWKSPVTVREIVVRQAAGSRNIAGVSQLSVEVWSRGHWKKVAALGDGSGALPINVLAQFSADTALKLRISGLRGSPRFREIEIYEGPNPPYMDVRGDPAGEILGILTDAWGTAPIRGAEIRASGTAGGRIWTASTRTEPSGEFSLPMPVGLLGSVHFVATGALAKLEKTVESGDLHEGLAPIPAAANSTVQLTGKWRFEVDPPQGFEQPGFDDAGWAEIEAPSHWVMKGFHSESGVGGYRRRVRIPLSWNGQRIRLAFDGVYSGAEVWVNGQRVGSHLGGANPFQLDVTSVLRPGRANLIAVKVSE